MDQQNEIGLYESPAGILENRRALELTSTEAGERQESPGLREYWRIIRERRATIVTILFVVFTSGLIATLKEKPVYRGRGLIEIQMENPDIPTLQELFQAENASDAYLETQYRILESENLARRVIAQLKLNQTAEFRPSSTDPKDSPQHDNSSPQVFAVAGAVRRPSAADIDNELLKKFQDRLDIEPLKRSRLVEISFESNDSKLAAQVVNTLADTYIQQNLEVRWQASQKASEWLSQQLLDMKIQLEKSEDAVQQYARENGLLFLETDKGTTENIVTQRLRELQEELTKAQTERYEKESIYRLIEQHDFAALPGVFNNKLMQDLTERSAELERERSRLSAIFYPDYPQVKEIQSQIDESQQMLSEERDRAAQAITNDYRAAVDREEMLSRAFEAQQKQADVVADKSVQYNILKREADTNKQLYVGLLQKLKETGVSTSLKAANIRVVDPAYPPKKPVRPGILLNLSLALVFGIALGVGGAFLQEHLDNTFKTAGEVERFLHLSVLASVPAVQPSNGHGAVHGLYQRARVLTSDKSRPGAAPRWNRIGTSEQNSDLAEAFHGLRTSVLLSTAKRPPNSLLVMSAQGREGKTTVATNLAISLAQLGERVLLVDADLRRPSVHEVFGIRNSSGLVNYLTGNSGWRSLVHHAEPAGLDALFCGPVPPNPVDLLSSDYMRNLIREASKEYRFTVLDSPPLLNLADSRILATLVDGVILVVGGGITPRELVYRAYSSALEAGAHVLGATINFADTQVGYYSAYQQDRVEND